ncbi:MAG: hypothetical protein L6290_03805 [Thermodesulfovibrionales bacterium]|nr:hypothetical protein [Thermodesulfovibrionales bacterium]
MKKKVLLSGMILAISIFLCGCPLESEFPLSIPETAQLDRDLIGNWKFINPEKEEVATITISPFNDHELIIISPEENKNISAYRAFVTCLNGEKFLNVQEIEKSEDNRHWLFVNYSIRDNRLTLRILEDTLMKNKKIDTPQALSRIIEKNLKNKDLYSENSEMLFERL